MVWSWGFNSQGELGVGDSDPRVHPYPVLALKGKSVTSLSTGGAFVMALGQNIKKEIPGLNLGLKQGEEEVKKKGMGGGTGKK